MLVALGARHITVLSRGGLPTSGKNLIHLERWSDAGVEIEAPAVNVADFAKLKVTLLLRDC